MKDRGLCFGDDGVSPVIGVILMIAITVALIASITTFVLNTPNELESGPQADFTFDFQGDQMYITLEEGEKLDSEKIYFRGKKLDSEINDKTWLEVDANTRSQIITGDTIQVPVDSKDFVLRIVYAEGDSSTTLQTHRGPGA